jgi:hypothetical protein
MVDKINPLTGNPYTPLEIASMGMAPGYVSKVGNIDMGMSMPLSKSIDLGIGNPYGTTQYNTGTAGMSSTLYPTVDKSLAAGYPSVENGATVDAATAGVKPVKPKESGIGNALGWTNAGISGAGVLGNMYFANQNLNLMKDAQQYARDRDAMADAKTAKFQSHMV